ncbi:MAG: proton-conducting transporter membrane subunit [Candidatus Bathyarchaeia archaeon]
MTIALAPMIIPVLSGIASVVLGAKSVKIRNFIITVAFIVAFLLNTYFLGLSIIGSFNYVELGEFTVNAASLFLSELILLLGLVGVLYSFGYIEERSETWAYYLFYQFFIAMMIGMVSSFNILVIYIFMEGSSVTSAVLVMFSRRRSSILAAYRYIALSIFGGIILVGGIFLQYHLTGNLNITILTNLGSSHLNILSTLYLLGLGVKAGLLPFGPLWLPPAHSEAPIPIHTLLSAALVQAAAFNIARVLGAIGITNIYISNMLLTLGLTSMLVGSLYALLEALIGSSYTRFHVGFRHIRGIKRVWAFSTISEVGYIATFLGLAGILASQGSADEALILGFGGALIHMYNHGFAKSQLLFDSGILIKMSHAEDLNFMGGLAKRLPFMKLSFTVGAFSLGLFPGTLGVVTMKELLFNDGVPIMIKATVVTTAGLSLAACCLVWYSAFFSKPNHKLNDDTTIPKIMYLPGLIMGALILAFGIYFTLEWIGVTSSSSKIMSVLKILAETMVKVSREA